MEGDETTTVDLSFFMLNMQPRAASQLLEWASACVVDLDIVSLKSRQKLLLLFCFKSATRSRESDR
jgi:hypothetical protein